MHLKVSWALYLFISLSGEVFRFIYFKEIRCDNFVILWRFCDAIIIQRQDEIFTFNSSTFYDELQVISENMNDILSETINGQ